MGPGLKAWLFEGPKYTGWMRIWFTTYFHLLKNTFSPLLVFKMNLSLLDYYYCYYYVFFFLHVFLHLFLTFFTVCSVSPHVSLTLLLFFLFLHFFPGSTSRMEASLLSAPNGAPTPRGEARWMCSTRTTRRRCGGARASCGASCRRTGREALAPPTAPFAPRVGCVFWLKKVNPFFGLGGFAPFLGGFGGSPCLK